MFTELDKLVTEETPIKLVITRGAGNSLKVCVMPTANAKNPALAQPLALSATAAELDEGFIDVLSTYVTNRSTLADQVAATAAILGEAAKAQLSKAVKSLKSSAKPAEAATGDSDDDDESRTDDHGDNDSAPAPVKAPAAAAQAKPSDDLLSLLED